MMLKKSIVVQLKFDEKISNMDGDEIHIFQAILNLVQNAVYAMYDSRYKSRNLSIETNMNTDLLTISIIDTGPGIPEENLNKLFNPFFTTKSTGMGLGLFITNIIINLHGGKIQVTSRREETIFTVTLPYSQSSL